MDVKVLKSNLNAGNVPNFLIFVEEEPALSKQYIKFVSDTANKAYKYYDSAEQVIYDIATNLKDDYVYIIYNDEKILKNLSFIDTLISFNRNIIVCLPSLDKSTNLYKIHKNYVVWFEKLDKYTLLAYAQKLCNKNKVAIDQDKLLTMIEWCNCNLGEMLNELDKVFTLGQANSNTLVDYMMNNGFSDYREVNTYNYINKILNRDMSALRDAVNIDDSPVGLAFGIYNQARNRLLSTKNCYYGKVMKKCFEVYNGVVDGTLNGKSALKYLTYSILF